MNVMKRTGWLTKVVALVCAMCLIFVPVKGYAAFGGEDGSSTVDFVLVLDCSGSLKKTDPHYLCSTACKMFLDMVPVENARIGIVAFGYDEGEAYVLNSRTAENSRDLNDVHLVNPLEEATALRDKAGIKESIDRVVQIAGDKTPAGTATLAAIDLLESSGSANDNACVILLTDGALTAGQNKYVDEENAMTAADVARSRGWPIYTIQLNDGRRNGADSKETRLMKEIAVRSGAGEESWCELTSFAEGNSDVTRAFLNIFNRFMFGGEGDVEVSVADENGVVERELNVPSLTSETTIVVSGNNIDRVQIVNPEGVERSITSDVDEQNIVASVENGNYVCIKLLCPMAGTWMVRAYGDPQASITMYDCSVKDLDLVLTTSLADTGTVLRKNDEVTFEAYFNYHGIDILNDEFYHVKQPMLVAVNTKTGQKAEFPMQAGEHGYVLKLMMGQIGEGTYDIYANLDDDVFRNGSKVSNSVRLSTDNMPVEITDAAIPAMTGYVNGDFDKTDLMAHISNPDGDELEFDLVCISDRNVSFDWNVDEEGYLSIACGLVPGDYQMQLSVKDVDMAEAMLFEPFMLTVINRSIELVGELPEMELWLDHYKFQKVDPEQGVIDLEAYFSDPDGVPLKISAATENGDLISIRNSGTVYTIEPAAKGKATVTVTVDDAASQRQESMKIKVVSGKSVFWAENWLRMVIVLAVLVIIVTVICVLIGTTRVKGVWEITVEDGEGGRIYVDEINIGKNTVVGRKKRFTLQGLLLEVAADYALENVGGLSSMLYSYPELNAIELKGVTFGSGFKINKIPTAGNVVCSINGLKANRNARIKLGEMRMDVEASELPTLTLRMKYLRER